MRVLFVQGAAERAGAEVALLGRLRHLPDHGIEPVVAMLADGPFVAEVRDAGFRVVRPTGSTPRLREPRMVAAAVRAVAAAARRADAAVLEGVGEKMAFVAGWAARLAGRSCVFSLHDAPRRSVSASAVQLAAMSGRRDAVVVPSHWMAREFHRAWRLEPHVVPNALAVDELPTRAVDVRGTAGWPSDSLVVGLFGRLVRWKGHEVLLRAAARLATTVPRARFLIAGGTLYGWERGYADHLTALTQHLGLTERVWFTGHRTDALGLMAGCDVVCHCSLEPEPFGVVIIEGMALGRAVVATRTGGPEELIADGRTGLLVAPGDEVVLERTIAELAADPRRRERLGADGRTVALRDYDSARLAGSLAAIYRQAAGLRP